MQATLAVRCRHCTIDAATHGTDERSGRSVPLKTLATNRTADQDGFVDSPTLSRQRCIDRCRREFEVTMLLSGADGEARRYPDIRPPDIRRLPPDKRPPPPDKRPPDTCPQFSNHLGHSPPLEIPILPCKEFACPGALIRGRKSGGNVRRGANVLPSARYSPRFSNHLGQSPLRNSDSAL